ncbi:regulatory protein RecX [Bermanella sp. WJH001]|uniref:regulatory protein RecX n=1 Tax=Bermanella sp. WJH001 TaxID=3048005 RepID=UPI0024BDD880|nr:regulatory protein RecX [Bermanella sp. WJH001]MDJ1539716.1 regulatory protein RecX [Bermanella sp. WJH001]
MFQRAQKKAAQQLDEKGLRHKVIELLARREYSYGELEQKLQPLTEDEAAMYRALDWVVEMGLQSDIRFTEMFIRSKAISGYGPVRIRMELRQKYIGADLIEFGFENIQDEINWSEEVDRLIEKKANGLDLSDMKSKNKVMGFLQRRGFNLDQIYAGFDRFTSSDT